MRAILTIFIFSLAIGLVGQSTEKVIENAHASAKKIVIEENVILIGPQITIYTKNSHSKSTQLLIALSEYGIIYNDVNVSYSTKTKDNYKELLADNGLSKREAKLPIVIYEGIMYYDIKDMKKFCKATLIGDEKKVKKSQRKF